MKARRIVSSIFVPVVAMFVLCTANPASAAVQTWGNVGTDWGTASNWFSALPGGADTAFFNLPAYSAQPNVGETSAVGGLWNTGSGPLTVGGAATLTINGTTISGNANTGVELDPGAGQMTISSPVTLGAGQQWFNNSGSTLNITGNVATAGFPLSITGSGATTINAAISGASGLTVGQGANVVLTAKSSYTGATTINGGMLTLQVSGQPPTLAAAGAPAPLVWFDPSNPAGYSLTGASVTTLINLSNSSTAGNAVVKPNSNNYGPPTLTVNNPAFRGLTTIHFNGSQALAGYDLSSLNGSSYTIFSVEGISTNIGTNLYLSSNDSGSNQGMHIGYQGGHYHLGQWANDLDTAQSYTYSGAEVATEWTVGLNTSTGHFIDQNGTQVASNTNTTGFSNLGLSNSNYGIIGAGWSYSSPYTGDLGEMLIYNSALTPAQQAGVEAYLIAKWQNPVMLPQTTPVILSSGGTLNLNGVSSTIGSLTSSDATTKVLLGGATLTTGNDGTNTLFAGAISGGTGGLTKIGAGAFTLTGSNTYSGPTTLTSGTLQFQGSHSLPAASPINFAGASALQVLNDGTGSGGTINVGNSIGLSAANTVTINVGNLVSSNTGNTVAFGVLSNGTPANAFNSTIDFTAANGYLQSYSGLALPGGSGNTTTLNPTTTSVIITGNVTNQMPTAGAGSDTLALSGTTSGNVIAGAISDGSVFTLVGSGDTRLTKSGTSVWTLTGANTFHGPITINASGGTLSIGGAGDLGDLGGSLGGSYTGTISIGSPGAFVMNTSSNQTLGGVISGAGAFYQNGSGVTTFAASNTYTGATTITAGTLALGTGGNIAAGSAIVDNSVLAFTRSDSAINGSAISGSGAVYQIGSGSTALTGSNTYTGSTFVNNGTLFLNGRTNNMPAIGVAGGATLGGSGTAASALVTVANGGGLSAGYNGAGSLTLAGLTFSNSGSINVGNAGNYTSLAALNVSGNNGLTANGGAGAVTIDLTGNAPPILNVNLRILKYSGAIQGAGLSGFSVNASGISNLPARGATFTVTGADAGYIDVYYNADYPIWTGAGDGTWSTALSPSNWKLASSGAPTTFLANDSAEFDDSAGANTTVTINAANVTPLSAVFKNNTASYLLQGSYGITGPAFLVMNGSGSLTITNSNGYTGGTTINAGQVNLGSASAIGTGPLVVNGGTLNANFAQSPTSVTLSGGLLNIRNAAALGASAGTITFNGGTFDNTSGGSLTMVNHPMIWDGSLGFGGSSPLNLGSGAVLLAGPSTLNLGGSTLTVGGVISGTGSSLTETGAGALLLAAANTFTGNTLVSGGTLLVGNASALLNSSVSAGGNGVVSFSSPTTATFGGLNGSGGIVLTNAAGAAVDLTVGNNNFDSSYSGAVSGSGSLTQNGSGTLYLSGPNTYSGGTTINAGAVQFQGNNSLPSGSPITLASASLQIRNDGAGSGGTINLGNNITIPVSNPNINPANVATIDVGNNRSGNTGNTVAFGVLSNITSYNLFTSTINFTASNGYLQSYSGLDLSDPDPNYGYSSGGTTTLNPTTTSVTIAGNVTNQEQDYYYDMLVLDGTSTGNVISGGISDSPNYGGVGQGDTRITKSNTSVWTLTGSNTYTGPTVISGGTLVIGGSGVLGGGYYSNTIANNGAFVVNTSSNQTFGGVISGSGGLYQLGSGVTTLTEPNTYTGPTTIVASTLVLGATGSILQSPMIWLGNGGTLDVTAQGANFHLVNGQTLTGAGTFSVAGAVTADSGSIILSASSGLFRTLIVGDLTLNPGSVLNFDFGTGQQDLINVTHSLTVNGGGFYLYQGDGMTALSTPGTYPLISYSGSLAGFGSNLSVLNQNPNEAYNFVANGSVLAVNILAANTWTAGGNPSFNWSNAANWSTSQAPASGSAILFSGTVGLTNTNDIPNLSLAGMIFSSSAGAFNLTGNSIQLAGAITNYSAATQTIGMNIGLSGGNQTLNAAAGNLVVNGVISDDGGAGLGINVSGSSAVVLAAANTFTGPTNIISGSLSLAHSLALQYSAVSVGSSGSLSFAPGIVSPTLGSLAGSGSFALTTAAAEPVALNVGSNGQSTTYSGVLSGLGGLVKQGAGTLTLTGSHTYSGPTVISGGVLQLQPVSGSGVSIGVQFVGNGSAITGSDGVFPMSNWNSLSGTSFTNVALTNSLGAATTAVLNASADGTYSTGNSDNLLNGYLYGGGTFSPVITGIPFRKYNVYAYVVDASSNSDAVVIGSGPTYYYQSLATDPFTQITNTAPGTYPGGNWVLANRLSGSSLTISTSSATGDYGMSGIEIVSLPSGNVLPATTPVTISNGATLDMTNGAQTIASLSSTDGMGSQVLLGQGALTIAGPGVTTFDGVISDGGNGGTVTLQGGGLTLTGVNTYTGPTTVSGGTLQLSSSAGQAISTSLAVSGGLVNIGPYNLTLPGVQITGGTIAGTTGVLTTSTSAYDAQNGVISAILGGTALLNKTTSGTVVLAGANTYSGSTSVTAGTLILAHPLAAQNSTVNLTGGTLGFAAGIVSPTLGGLTGNGSVALATAATQGVPQPVALNVGGNGQSTAYTGALSGPGSLVKQGAGTLTLSASQSYAGPTLITGGVLQLLGGSGGGAGGASIGIHFVGTGSSITGPDGPSGAVMSNWNNLTGGGVGTGVSFTNYPLVDYQGNASTAAISVSVTSGAYASGASDQLLNGYLYQFNSTPVPAVITGIPYAKYSIYIFSVDSNSGETTEITAGGSNYYYTPQVGTANDIAPNQANYVRITNTDPSLAPVGNYVEVDNLTGSSQTVTVTGYTGEDVAELAGIEIVSTGGGGAGGSNVLPATSPVTISNGATLDMTNGFQTIASLSSTDGMGSQVLVGSGVLTIAGPAVTTFDGVISGVNGSLTLQSGWLTLTGSNTYSGGTSINGGTLQLGNGAAGYDGSIANTSGVANNGALFYNLSGSQTASYAISGSGSLTKNGQGTLTLANGNNSYSGATNINAGLLVIALGSGALPQGPLNMSGGSLDLEGNSPFVLSLNGSGTIGNGASGSADEALFIVADGGQFSGTIQDGGFGGNAPTALAVVGGTLVLSGSNTFSGGTTVYAGTLVLNDRAALADGSTLIVGDPTQFGAASAAVSAGAAVVVAVPEPGSLALLGVAGIAAAAAVRRRRLRKAA
jgi:autotransporter-associated beta strand protein